MKIVAISDIHGRIDRLPVAEQDLAEADLVLLTGDITNFGREEQANQMLAPIRQRNEMVLAVTGNCDYPEVESLLTDLNINLHASARNLDEVTVIGLGGSLPGPASTPNEYSEGQLESFLEQARSQLDSDRPVILNSHQPPSNTVADRLPDGSHVGSTAVREFIQQQQPLVCFTGHIHEGVGVDEIGTTQIVNPGPLHTGHYAYAQIENGELKILEIRGGQD
ncbi:MAG: metallophosphoesterase [Anaerolineales bacterium]|nr:metallophosphoesterase [Anaerolineales bacterium]